MVAISCLFSLQNIIKAFGGLAILLTVLVPEKRNTILLNLRLFLLLKLMVE
jgi:hypothetical protein